MAKEESLTVRVGDPSAQWVTRRPPNRDLLDPAVFALARHWLAVCLSDHAPCRTESSFFRPRLLIDVNTADFDIVRLDDVSDHPEEQSWTYVALSYCWGGDQEGKTLTKNLADRFRGFSLRRQDKTIRDAVEVTRHLGLQYLWVDALCIVQDDPHDKAREIGRMHEVYQRAVLTVSASRAQSSKDGILGTCSPNFTQRLRYKGPGGGAEGSVIASVMAPNTSLSTEPINTRGWTLQEHLLSRRKLIFGTYGLKWSCNYAHEFDGSQEDQQWATTEEMAGLSQHDGAYASRVLTWHEVVAKFRERHLTAHEDRLPAIGAVAAEYKRLRNPGRYMAGLWSTTLPEDLLWEVIPRRSSLDFMSDPLMTRAAMDEVVDRCSTRDQGPRFPSWSWASVSGGIEYHGHHFDRGLVFCTCQLLSEDVGLLYSFVPFGQVTHGILGMRAYMAPVRCQAIGDSALGASHRPRNWKMFREASNRAAIFDREEDSRGNLSPRPSVGVILDTEIEVQNLTGCYLFEVFRARNAALGDEAESDVDVKSEGGSDASEDDEFEPITYSVGLLLQPVSTGDNSFNRVGIYKMQDIHDDYYNVTNSGLSLRPHFWEWTKCFTQNDIRLG